MRIEWFHSFPAIVMKLQIIVFKRQPRYKRPRSKPWRASWNQPGDRSETISLVSRKKGLDAYMSILASPFNRYTVPFSNFCFCCLKMGRIVMDILSCSFRCFADSFRFYVGLSRCCESSCSRCFDVEKTTTQNLYIELVSGRLRYSVIPRERWRISSTPRLTEGIEIARVSENRRRKWIPRHEMLWSQRH